MALRLSTGLRNAVLDQKAVATNLIYSLTVAFEEGTGTDSRDRIVDASTSLLAYRRRDKITVSGSTSNDGTYEILGVAAGYVEVAAGSLTTEALGDPVILAGANGGSFTDLFRNCVIDIYTGSQPTDANTAEAGTKLASITLAGGIFVGGATANGINFGEVVAGVLSSEAGETWSGTGISAGTAGWFRCYDNAYTVGASTSLIRFDGAVATSGSQLNMTNTAVTVDGTTTIDSVALTLPAS